jgi:hypothetical protein
MSIYNVFYGPVKNNGGTALKAGTASSIYHSALATFSNNTRTLDFPFGSTVIDGVNVTGLSQNSLVPVPNNLNQKPLIKRATRSNNVLQSPGNLSTALTSSIHNIESYRTRLEHTAYKDGYLNILTGKFDSGYPDNQRDEFGADSAANPSRNNPGVIIFKNGRNISIIPYQPKTN